ncbi:shikimate kinase [Robiginitalea sediminis]|uniref:shikimate kinase n=1 Tax=Robiginitalea sediminis TaxID=1982593 RepID=UPI000B4AD3B4|nr:shikimate kinase [Robiginitalea sediminis]
MVIALVGYMGSGKSTVGQALAQQLGIPFVDFDRYIENRIEQTIPEIFQTRGELFFRRTEHELLKELLAEGAGMVLALGGGTPCYAGNMDLLLAHTPHVVYLQLSVGALTRRLQGEKQERPLIAHLPDAELPEFIGKHLFERAPFYGKAPITIIADHLGPEEVVSEIRALLV